ncbi:hypothetical protein T4B_15113 [Trichinella pseudospiralis]|uniref:Uncharacterized protein n=1 Tax=Trichinella pseudospiralis TaxID=6337 RepID=A0A0V1GID9_TRIPS|nr:hypothetical protein T4B_15113 [Trichinella pseudospiralis]
MYATRESRNSLVACLFYEKWRKTCFQNLEFFLIAISLY